MADKAIDDSVKALSSVKVILEKKHKGFTEGMKSGDTKAARKALSCEADIGYLERVQKRLESGSYSE